MNKERSKTDPMVLYFRVPQPLQEPRQVGKKPFHRPAWMQFAPNNSELCMRSPVPRLHLLSLLLLGLHMPRSFLLVAIWGCAAQCPCCVCPVCFWPGVNLAVQKQQGSGLQSSWSSASKAPQTGNGLWTFEIDMELFNSTHLGRVVQSVLHTPNKNTI